MKKKLNALNRLPYRRNVFRSTKLHITFIASLTCCHILKNDSTQAFSAKGETNVRHATYLSSRSWFSSMKIVTAKFGRNICALPGEEKLAVLFCGGILFTHIIRCDIVADTENYQINPVSMSQRVKINENSFATKFC